MYGQKMSHRSSQFLFRRPAHRAAALAVALWLVVWTGCGQKPESLPRLGTAPEFQLTDQFAQPVSMVQDLRGKVLLVNFIYTRCTDTCPIQTARMAALQQELVRQGIGFDQLRLVSISVDPEQDTPAVLQAYAERHRAAPGGWHFLTGPAEQVRQVIVEGFKVGAEVPGAAGHGGSHQAAAGIIAHSDRTVLVDPEGNIRAYYPGEPWEPERILAAVKSLVRP